MLRGNSAMLRGSSAPGTRYPVLTIETLLSIFDNPAFGFSTLRDTSQQELDG